MFFWNDRVHAPRYSIQLKFLLYFCVLTYVHYSFALLLLKKLLELEKEHCWFYKLSFLINLFIELNTFCHGTTLKSAFVKKYVNDNYSINFQQNSFFFPKLQLGFSRRVQSKHFRTFSVFLKIRISIHVFSKSLPSALKLRKLSKNKHIVETAKLFIFQHFKIRPLISKLVLNHQGDMSCAWVMRKLIRNRWSQHNSWISREY